MFIEGLQQTIDTNKETLFLGLYTMKRPFKTIIEKKKTTYIQKCIVIASCQPVVAYIYHICAA